MTSEDGFPKLSAPARTHSQLPVTRASSSWLRSPSPTSRSSTAWDRRQYPLYERHSTTEVSRSARNTGTGTNKHLLLRRLGRATPTKQQAPCAAGSGESVPRLRLTSPRVGAEPVPGTNRRTGPLVTVPPCFRDTAGPRRAAAGRSRTTGSRRKRSHAPGRCRSTASTIGISGRRLDRTEKRSRGSPDRDPLSGRCQKRAGWGYRGTTVNWDLRHRKSSLVIRLLLAVWITAVVVVLCATGR